MFIPNTSYKTKGRRGRRNKRYSEDRTDRHENTSDNDSDMEKAVISFPVALKCSKDNNSMRTVKFSC